MAKRIKLGTTVLIAVLSAVVVGGVVGGIAAASKGFDEDILNEWVTPKEDYVRINLSNKYEEKALTTDSALEFFNYDNKVFSSVDLITGVTLDNGALVVADGGALTATFDDISYNRVAITASANYVENYEDEDGNTKIDIFGNKVVQSITSADSIFSLDGHDAVTFKAGKDDESYPRGETKTFSYDEGVSQFKITVADGDLRITSIEFWNVDVEDAEVSSEA